MLKEEFQYYLDNQKELVEKYNGKFLVIKHKTILGAYNSQGEAYDDAKKTNEVGTFLIQHCVPGAESYTQTFHSRVIINSISA